MDTKRQAQIIREILSSSEESLFRAQLARDLDAALGIDASESQAQVDRFTTIVAELKAKLASQTTPPDTRKPKPVALDP